LSPFLTELINLLLHLRRPTLLLLIFLKKKQLEFFDPNFKERAISQRLDPDTDSIKKTRLYKTRGSEAPDSPLYPPCLLAAVFLPGQSLEALGGGIVGSRMA
jgi:hypothetical protein